MKKKKQYLVSNNLKPANEIVDKEGAARDWAVKQWSWLVLATIQNRREMKNK